MTTTAATEGAHRRCCLIGH